MLNLARCARLQVEKDEIVGAGAVPNAVAAAVLPSLLPQRMCSPSSFGNWNWLDYLPCLIGRWCIFIRGFCPSGLVLLFIGSIQYVFICRVFHWSGAPFSRSFSAYGGLYF